VSIEGRKRKKEANTKPSTWSERRMEGGLQVAATGTGATFGGTRPGKEGATSEGWAGALAAARPSNTRE
jgi:hypothetical protein